MPKRKGSGIRFLTILVPSWPSKTKPRRSKIDVEMASKFDHFLKASWNAIFSAKRRAKRPRAAPKWAPTRKVRAVGRIMEGFIRQNSKDI